MIQVENNNQQLGKIGLGTTNNLTFTLCNLSNEEFTLINLKPGCGSCTTARASSTHLEVDGKVQVIATFIPNSTGFNDKKVDVYLTKKNGQQTTVTLYFQAFVA